ncbi:unnamed protein product, partial [Nesidiocoris tenuis]
MKVQGTWTSGREVLECGKVEMSAEVERILTEHAFSRSCSHYQQHNKIITTSFSHPKQHHSGGKNGFRFSCMFLIVGTITNSVLVGQCCAAGIIDNVPSSFRVVSTNCRLLIDLLFVEKKTKQTRVWKSPTPSRISEKYTYLRLTPSPRLL